MKLSTKIANFLNINTKGVRKIHFEKKLEQYKRTEKTACNICNSFQEGYPGDMYGGTMGRSSACNHPICFEEIIEKTYDPIKGTSKSEPKNKRIDNYDTLNKEGECPSFELIEMDSNYYPTNIRERVYVD